MDIPAIGRIVIYRHTDGYDVPAVVTASTESLRDAENRLDEHLDERLVRPLSSVEHLHLTVLTPSTSVEAGAQHVRDVPFAGDVVMAGTWRWPAQHAIKQELDIGALAVLVSSELNRRASMRRPA